MSTRGRGQNAGIQLASSAGDGHSLPGKTPTLVGASPELLAHLTDSVLPEPKKRLCIWPGTDTILPLEG